MNTTPATATEYEARVRACTSLDELEGLLDRDHEMRRWMFGDPEDPRATAYRWHEFVPTFGGAHAGDAVDGWYVLSWDESRVLWLHPDEGTRMQERSE